jgi:hypothetical protein
MADRTVNININYKVNTADVLKAQQATTAAQKATDNLRKSTEQYGKTATTAGRDASAGLKSVGQAAQNTTTQTQSLSSSFGGLATAVKAVITVGIVREVASIAINMAALQGKVEGVEKAFKRAFPNSLDLLNQLKKATHGTVTEFELMQRTLQATNLGLSVQQLPELFEFAATRAQQTGESVDYLVDSIVRGIGRKSPLILDNLGISAIRLKEKFDGAALASQSVADVTKAVAEIAREEMGKMGGYVETAATKVDKLNVSWEQLKTTIAKKLDTSGFVTFLDNVLDKISAGIKGSKELMIEQLRADASREAAAIMESKAFKDFGNNQQGKFDLIQQEINSRTELIVKYSDTIATLKQERAEIEKTNPYDKRLDNINKQIQAYNINKFSLASVILALKEYLKTINLVNAAEDSAPSSGIIERKKAEIKAIQEQIEKTNKLSDLGVGGRLTIALEIAQAELGDLQRAFTDFKIEPFKIEVKDAAKALGDISPAIDRIEESMERLKTFKFPPAQTPYTPTFWDKVGDEVRENWRDITSQGIDIQADQLKSLAETELNTLKNRLGALRDFYSGQQTLAGNNERAKEQLRIKEERETVALQRKIFEKEKQVRKTQAIIDGAAGIVKAFATYPYPAALVISALIAAQTASQIAIMNRQQPRFKEGVIDLPGPGTGTSDSIPARLSRGESVITAQRTKEAKGILTAVRDGKINDKVISQEVLNKLHLTKEGVTVVGMSDERIVNELRKQTQPDYMAHANLLFEVRKSSDGLHKKIRRKSMG